MSQLHAIYRSYGGDSRSKTRPPFYSKPLALASFFRACDQLAVKPDLTFINDGPIADHITDEMRRRGTVLNVNTHSNRGSYRAAISFAAKQSWSQDDLIWFAEDDYLYTPAALETMMAASTRIPRADYFSLWGCAPIESLVTPPPGTQANHDGTTTPREPGLSLRVMVNSAQWYPIVSTTSSFAVRPDVLRADQHILRYAPFTGGSWDHTSCVMVQGIRPFTWESVAGHMLPFTHLPPRQWPKSAARAVLETAANLCSHRTPAHRRRFYGTKPLTLHMEWPIESDAQFWTGQADDVARWAAEHQILGFDQPPPSAHHRDIDLRPVPDTTPTP